MPGGTETCFGAIALSPPSASAPGGSSGYGETQPKPLRGEGGDSRVYALGFTSTRRFAGLFRLRPPSGLQVIVDTEGLPIAPGPTGELEEFTPGTGQNREAGLGHSGA